MTAVSLLWAVAAVLLIGATAFQPVTVFRHGHQSLSSSSTTTLNARVRQQKKIVVNQDEDEEEKTEIFATGVDPAIIPGVAELEETIDFGRCGVRLAEESAVRLSGTVFSSKKQGQAELESKTMDNFLKVSSVTKEQVTEGLDKIGAKLVVTAAGLEEFKDVGEGTVAVIEYGPDEAAKVILAEAPSIIDASKVIINVLGGDDTILDHVFDAVTKLVNGLDIKTGAEIEWNSLCYKEFPVDRACISIVTMDKPGKSMLDKKLDTMQEGDEEVAYDGPTAGLEIGEVYFNGGEYVILSDDDVVEDFTEWAR